MLSKSDDSHLSVGLPFKEKSTDDVTHCRATTSKQRLNRSATIALDLDVVSTTHQMSSVGGANAACCPPNKFWQPIPTAENEQATSKGKAQSPLVDHYRLMLIDTQPVLSSAAAVSNSTYDDMWLMALQQILFLLRV